MSDAESKESVSYSALASGTGSISLATCTLKDRFLKEWVMVGGDPYSLVDGDFQSCFFFALLVEF
jgi:hypothetical protein